MGYCSITSLSYPLSHMFLILMFVSYYIAWPLLLTIIFTSQVVVVESLSCVQLFCDPMDCSPPGTTAHGISHARTLEWVTISSFRGSSQPRYRTCISCGSYIGRWILHRGVTWEALEVYINTYRILRDSSVQSRLHVWLIGTPWVAVCQASLFLPTLGAYTNSCPYSQWCHPTISSSVNPFSSRLQSFPALGCLFKWVSSLHQMAKVLEFQLQHQSFQWIFRTDFL